MTINSYYGSFPHSLRLAVSRFFFGFPLYPTNWIERSKDPSISLLCNLFVDVHLWSFGISGLSSLPSEGSIAV